MGQCKKDALTDVFGWFLQFLQACLAFTCLIAKRFCEPVNERRSWLIWFYDTSKQATGALTIHLVNVWLAGEFNGDPCSWYVINFLLDSSLGLVLIYIGIKFSQQYLAKIKGCEVLNFGEYGTPPSSRAWLAQCFLYTGLMVFVKLCIVAFMQLQFMSKVKEIILSPIKNPKVEITLVILIIPFFVNILKFWLTDNFLMYTDGKRQTFLYTILNFINKLIPSKDTTEREYLIP